MYIGTMQEKIREAKIARTVLDLAGLDVETALVTIEAVSDAQRNFAGDVRLHAVAQMWSEDIDAEYQTPAMAKAIFAAVNRHVAAKFWLDNKNATFAHLLSDDIDAELGE